MSIRTTITLDDDVAASLREASLKKGVPFKKMVNDAIRSGLPTLFKRPKDTMVEIKPFDMGVPKMPIDNIHEVLEYLEREEGKW